MMFSRVLHVFQVLLCGVYMEFICVFSFLFLLFAASGLVSFMCFSYVAACMGFQGVGPGFRLLSKRSIP